MNRWARIRLWLARRLVRGLEVEITRAAAWRDTEAGLFDLMLYSRKSGHLSRAYHAGKVLRVKLQKALETIGRRAVA